MLRFAALETKELERGVRELALLLEVDVSPYLRPGPTPYKPFA